MKVNRREENSCFHLTAQLGSLSKYPSKTPDQMAGKGRKLRREEGGKIIILLQSILRNVSVSGEE